MRIFSLTLALICSSALFSEDRFNFTHIPTKGDEKVVLVLAPGQNTDGSHYLHEEKWINFAKHNNLGIIALNYYSNPEDLYGTSKKGYFRPDLGSGQALLNEIKRIYGKDLPIIIFGFSGGAQFAVRFVNWIPDRIIAWCAYSFPFSDIQTENFTKIRGIVACGELDRYKWAPSYDLFYKGRVQKCPWIWISVAGISHTRSDILEDFVLEFFSEELDIFLKRKEPQEDVWSDISLPEQILDSKVAMQSTLAVPFRTIKLMNTWKKMHSP